MRALLDVNVLVALLDSDHLQHGAAWSWLDAHADLGWASSPTTQNGCIRVLSSPSYPGPLRPGAIIERLADAAAGDLHAFWPDDVTLLSPEVVDPARVHGPRQVTDLYLLALAVAHGGRLVTFDGRIPLSAVPSARPEHLVTIDVPARPA